jgi:hypothetical protein
VVGFNRFGTLNRFGGIAPLHAGTRFSNLAHIDDAHISRGVSTVGAGQFGAGRTTAVAATHEQLSSAHMMTGNMPVVPTRASLSASGRAAAPSTIHNNVAQHFAGTQNRSRPESFQQQTAHLQQVMQQNHFSPVTAGRSTTAGATAGKTNASTAAAGRETNNSASRGEGNQADRSAGSTSRGETSSEWKTFTPPSHGDEQAGRDGNNSETASRGQGSYWNRTAPSSNYSRESASGNSASGNYERGSASRPQLNMRQPIVQPRSSGGYGGYHAAPSGGSHSAPSGGGHSSGGGSHSSGGHH